MTRNCDFDFELYVSLREHCGPRSEWPTSYRSGQGLFALIHKQLGDADTARFLNCAAHAIVLHDDQKPGGFPLTYSDCLTRELWKEFGTEPDEQPDIAWQLFMAAYRILGKDDLTEFVLRAHSALKAGELAHA